MKRNYLLHTSALAFAAADAKSGGTAAADTASKPGRKPKPEYVPKDFSKPIAAVITQGKSGAKVELFDDPTSAAAAAMEHAKKGHEAVTFGPQVQRFVPATVNVETFGGAAAAPAYGSAPASDTPAS